ncbi:DnaA/Hda family protein [Candidatus Persebacteraceae bacterium Df01]|jgi:DnaA family protein|uniref:DnaA/Hda family protein n=1 Tax=Candidatus Doriopsillibacter californiensis TaxID=2970740 RepID=A0ABT7QNS0_9GAMM|nr:DnaA/Hda family protein [Candidatus Persebacteraceae bacterium Df01]
MGGIHSKLLPFAPPPPEFDDFVEGENRQALRAVRALINNQSSTQSVYLWGGGGCGKTYLLRVAVTAARRNGGRAFFCAGDVDIPPPMPGFLATDDIHLLNATSALSLFDWFNVLRQDSGYYILASGDAPVNQITSIGSELAARLAAGLVFHLRELSDDEKGRALARYAERRGFVLPQGVSALFLTRLPRDMTSLITALVDLDHFLLNKQKPLTLSLAHQWLKHWHSDGALSD